MATPRLTIVLTVAALLIGSLVVAQTSRSVGAQAASDLSISFAPNVTKAKIGDIVVFDARIENIGAETLTGLSLSLGLPDALDARTVACPTPGGGTVADCLIGDLSPGDVSGAQFYVHIGSRDRQTNGPVTLFVTQDGMVLSTIQIAPIKIVGSPRGG